MTMLMNIVPVAAAVLASIVLVVLGLRTYFAFHDSCGGAVKARRCTATLAGMLAVALLWGNVAGVLPVRSTDGLTDEQNVAGTVDEDPVTFRGADPIPAVNLTADQVKAFLADYSLEFSSNSLASRNDERKQAIRAYGQEFTDPVSFPMSSWLDQIDNILSSKLSAEERQAQLDALRHDLNQSIISNPVIGDMWAQALVSLDLVTEENGWIADFLAKADEYYARPEPTKDSDPPRGLSALVTYADSTKSKIVVTDEYSTFAAKLCTLLEYFEFQKVTQRTSIRNWCNAIQGEDSASRTMQAKYQENRKALLMAYTGKDGSEVIAVGINLYDQRVMIFGKDKTEPTATPTTPSTPTTTPTTPTEPEKPKETPSHTLTIEYVYSNGTKAAETVTKTLKEGAKYSVDSPVITGWTADRPTVSGTMGQKDVYVKVTYSQNPTKTETPKHLLSIAYVYEDGSKAAETYTEWLEEGASYNVTSPTISGYTPDKPVVSGTMGKTDISVTVTYKCQHTLTIHYVYEGGGKAANDYTAKLWAGDKFSVTSPTITGYKPDQAVVSGTMGIRDIEITVTYSKVSHTLTIHYVYNIGGRAAPDYTGEYLEGQHYSVRSPSITGWTPVTSLVEGTMGKTDLEFTVEYTRDGAGVKDPAADPVNQGNAPIGGGSNKPDDGTGDYQPEEPPRHDYTGDHTGGDQSTGQDRTDLDQNGNSTTPLTPTDNKESSGTGGVDHPIVDGNGGTTFGGDIPDKNPIEVTTTTTVTDTTTTSNNDGTTTTTTTTTNTSGEHNSTAIAEPD